MKKQDILFPVGLACLLALTACGGSDGGGSDPGGDPPPPPPPPPVADTEPDKFAFGEITNLFTDMIVVSQPVEITGIEEAADVGVTGGKYAINDGAFTDKAGKIKAGDQVRVLTRTSKDAEKATKAVLEIGGIKGEFSVATGPAVNLADVDPAPFVITDAAGVEKGQTVTSDPFTVMHINAPAPITVTDGEYRIEDGKFTSKPGTVLPGQRVQVRGAASKDPGVAMVATLRIGNVQESLVLVTKPADGQADVIPDFFVFTPKVDAEPDTDVDSDAVTISGLSEAAPITIVGGEYSLNGGAKFVDTGGQVTNGSSLIVRARSSAISAGVNIARVWIGGVPGDFLVMTRAATFGSDAEPDVDSFIFGSTETAELGATVESEWKVPTAYDAPAPVSVAGGEYRLSGGAYTAEPQLMLPGQAIRARGTAPDTIGESQEVMVTIGGVSRAFRIDAIASSPGNNPPIILAVVANGTFTGVDNTYTVPLSDGEFFLDAIDSVDPDTGDAIESIEWTQLSGPEVTIEPQEVDPGFAIAAFTEAGEYVFQVTASDGEASSTLDVTAIVEPPNTPPVADAGVDQTVDAVDGVTLDGSGSTDAEDGAAGLSYLWSVTSAPAFAQVAFSDATSSQPHATFSNVFAGNPPPSGDYTFTLTVTDSKFAFAQDTVIVTVEGEAAAGPEAVIDVLTATPAVGADVNLSGGNSTGAIGYAWALVNAPSGSFSFVQPGFSNPSLASFTPDLSGQ